MRPRAKRLRCAVIAFTILTASSALAVQPDEILPNPVLEARARNLSKELRCMVCQNQSIDDSDAPLARDLRLLVRERLKAGDSDRQVLDFLDGALWRLRAAQAALRLGHRRTMACTRRGAADRGLRTCCADAASPTRPRRRRLGCATAQCGGARAPDGSSRQFRAADRTARRKSLKSRQNPFPARLPKFNPAATGR